ncbi:MAG: hypothetical protein WA485_23195, partial [Candidatus Sulfotelmatobacter sp.]
LAYDSRAGQRRIWAATSSFWGTLLRSSDDFGKSWTNPQQAPVRFPADAGASLKNIWQITLGPPDEANVLYCGVEPAALFETRDAGETWSLIRGLFDHPHRPRWMAGNGGLALHSIVLDPANKQRMYVAISAGGVYRTEDGGATWTAQNKGISALFMPDKYPEFGQCVHKIAMHPARPERLFLQNHRGIYRSDNCAGNWTDIANGVPSDFGFPVVMHPHNPDCAYVVPVESGISLLMRWPPARLSNAQCRRLLGSPHARIAAKAGLRDRLARCHDRGFLRSCRALLWDPQRATLWLE